MSRCAGCGCQCDAGAATHVIRAALLEGDVDLALDAGLLEAQACGGCSRECGAVVIAARDARRVALAARERFRAREARLQRRARERAEARRPTSPGPSATATRPPLPPAAAAALARARAKVAGNRSP